jgi:hypothetical protein
VNVVSLEKPAEVRLIRGTCAQPFDRRRLVPEGFQKGIRKFRGVERLLRKVSNGLLYLNSVHCSLPVAEVLGAHFAWMIC